ncbi:MAG: hypothetical protein ACJA2S_003896 [Cyclobacteriaceae bacterium]|jgi:uncharacterized protein (TIGR02646 family)
MRKVIKDYGNPPGQLGPIPIHNQRLIAIYDGIVLDTDKIHHYVYAEETVKKALSRLYHDKCAYCETKDQEFEIEHYRPKRGVEGIKHSGYYWLCYEWSNLLPACHDCNKKRSKSTKFPIEGARVNAPVINAGIYRFNDHNLLARRLKRELPLLVHPEEPDFSPEAYFKFDKSGWMSPAANSSTRKYRRAKETIENIIRLNRDPLFLNERKDGLRIYEKRLLSIFLLYFKNHQEHGKAAADSNLQHGFYDIMKEIREKGSPDKEYSFFWSDVFNNFYSFLPDKLKNRPKDKARFLNLIVAFK